MNYPPPLPDSTLFDFDKDQLVHWDDDHAALLLRELPDLYRNHLGIALKLDIWADRLEAQGSNNASGRAFPDYVNALREVAAHLRLGNFVPGGRMLDEPVSEAQAIPSPSFKKMMRQVGIELE